MTAIQNIGMAFGPNLIGLIQDNTVGNDGVSLTFTIMTSMGILTAIALMISDYKYRGGVLQSPNKQGQKVEDN